MPIAEVICIHFDEIALKGRNRPEFEKRLVDNIKRQLGANLEKIEKKESRIIATVKDTAAAQQTLVHVMGVDWLSPAFSTPKDLEVLIKTIIENRKYFLGKTIKVESKRSDKSFPLNSIEISKKIGTTLAENGFQIDMHNPNIIIRIEVLMDRILVLHDKINGPGGLPYGASGKLLCLLSGGIDSPVAAWMMMKRGCIVDFLHIHPFSSNDEVKKSKMIRLLSVLRSYSPIKLRMFMIPYMEYYKNSVNIEQKNELIVFRRFIIKLANEICGKEGYFGLVTGDSVGQVASQTLENLQTTNEAAELPVYRPLAGFSKKEIIWLAKKIGVYETSIEEYKDCCSLVAAKHPATRVKLEVAKKIEEKIRIDEIVKKTLEQTESVEI